MRYLAEFAPFRRANGPTFRYLHKNSVYLRHFHRITEPMSATTRIIGFFLQKTDSVSVSGAIWGVWRDNWEMYGKTDDRRKFECVCRGDVR